MPNPNPNLVEDYFFGPGNMVKINPDQEIFPDKTVKPSDVRNNLSANDSLMSLLHGLAATNPQKLMNLFTINDDHTVTVHFFKYNTLHKEKLPNDVTIEASVDEHFAKDAALWVRLLAKAIAATLPMEKQKAYYHNMDAIYQITPAEFMELIYSDVPVSFADTERLKGAENLEAAKKMFVEDLRRIMDQNGILTFYNEITNSSYRVTGLSERNGVLGVNRYSTFGEGSEGWMSIDELFNEKCNFSGFYDKGGLLYAYKESPYLIKQHIMDRKTVEDYEGKAGPWAFSTEKSLTKPVEFAFFKDYVKAMEDSGEKIGPEKFAEYKVCSNMTEDVGQEEYEKHSVTLRRLNKMLNDQVTENNETSRIFYDVFAKCNPVTLQEAKDTYGETYGALGGKLRFARSLNRDVESKLKIFEEYSRHYDADALLQMEKENRLIDPSDLEGSMKRVFVLETFRALALFINARVELDVENVRGMNYDPIVIKACAFAQKLDPKARQQEVERIEEYLDALNGRTREEGRAMRAEERKRAEEARKKAEEDRKKKEAEEARKKAEEARKKIEAEENRKKEAEDAKRKTEEAREKAEEAKRKAAQELKAAEEIRNQRLVETVRNLEEHAGDFSEADILSAAEALKERFDEFDRQINKNQTQLAGLDSYKKFTERLTHLVNDLMKPYYEEQIHFDRPDDFRKMTPETFRELLKTYNEVLDASAALLADMNKIMAANAENKPEETEFLKNMAVVLGYAEGFMGKDIAALSDLEPTAEVFLPDVIKNARTRQISIQGKDIKIEGANSSERIPLTWKDEEGKEHKGFFTKDKVIHYRDQIKNSLFKNVDKSKVSSNTKRYLKEFLALILMNPKIANNPERLRHYLFSYSENKYTEMRLADCFINMDLYFERGTAKKFVGTNSSATPEQMNNRLAVQEIVGTDRESKVENCHKYFKNLVIATLKDLERVNSDIFIDWVEDNGPLLMSRCEGSSIAQRNSAMSAVANLLGVGHLIAHAENMTVNIDGKPVDGVFMEQAEGEDLGRVTENSNLYKLVQKEDFSVSNLQVNKDLFSLQLLDYLCNNLDRHGNNVMYKVNPDNTAIIGLQGIDNDKSFGNNYYERDEKFRKANKFAMNIAHMRYVPKELAANVLSLSPAMLDLTLKGYQLTEPERQAAVKRLNQLKEAIRDKTIEMVDDAFLSSPGLMEQYYDTVEGRNVFSLAQVLTGFKKYVNAQMEEFRQKKDKVIKYAEAGYQTGERAGLALDALNTEMERNQKEKADFLERLRKNRKTLEEMLSFFKENEGSLTTLDQAKYPQLLEAVNTAMASCTEMDKAMRGSYFTRALFAASITGYVDAMKKLSQAAGFYAEAGAQKADLNDMQKNALQQMETLKNLAVEGESLPQILKKPEMKADRSRKKYTFTQIKAFLEKNLAHDEKGNVRNVVENGTQFICHKMLEELNRIGKQNFDEAGYDRVELQTIYEEIKRPSGKLFNNFLSATMLKRFKAVSHEEAERAYQYLIRYVELPNEARKWSQEGEVTVQQQQFFDHIRGEFPENVGLAYLDEQIKLAKDNDHYADFVKYRTICMVLNLLTKDNQKLEAMEAEYHKYDPLKYDREQVNRNLADHVSVHPELTREQIAQEKKKLIIEERILSSYVQIATREGKSPEEIDQLVAGLKKNIRDLREFQFFAACPEDKMVPYLQAYCNRADQAEHVDAFKKSVSSQYSAIAYSPQPAAYYENFGKAIHKGLFAGKPDPKDLVFTNQGTVDKNLTEWQKGINAIEIEPGNYLKNSELVEFAVMGNFLSEKASDRLRKQKPGRDETSYNIEQIHLKYFENMLANCDDRQDSQELRCIVAEARDKVKKDIEKNSDQARIALKDDLQSAFKAMYRHCRNIRSLDHPSLYYCSVNMAKLYDLALKEGIVLELSGEELKECKRFQEERMLIQHIVALKEQLRSEAAEMLHGNWKDPAYDLTKNPKLYDEILEIQALDMIRRQIDEELKVTNLNYEDVSANRIPNAPQRNITMTEKLFGKNPERLISYYKNLVVQRNSMQSVLGAKTEEERFSILSQGGFKGLNTDKIHYYDANAYEQAAAAYDINKILSDFDRRMAEFEELDENEYDAKADVRKMLRKMKSAISKLSAARAKIAHPETENNISKLEPYYKQVADACRQYMSFTGKYVGYDKGFQDLMYTSLQHLAEHAEGIKTWRLNQAEDKMISGIFKNAQAKPNFEKFYAETYQKLSALASEKKATEGCSKLLEDMYTLHNNLSSTKLLTGAQILGNEGYGKVLADVNQLLQGKTKGVDEDMKYFLISLKAQLVSDKAQIEYLSNSEDFLKDYETVNDRFSDEISTGYNERLKNAMEQMDHVSSRTGGNSDEFKDILKKMEAVKNLQLRGNLLSNEYLRAVSALAESTDAYIKAKKIVPGSLKGKDRLKTAKRMRDICGNLAASVFRGIGRSDKDQAMTGYKDVMNLIKKNKSAAMKKIEDLYDTMKLHKNTGTYEDRLRALLEKDLIKAASAYLYWEQLGQSAYELSPEQLNTLCGKDTANQQIEMILPGMRKTLHHFDFGQLEPAIKNHSVAEMLYDGAKPFLKLSDLKALAENPKDFHLFEQKAVEHGNPVIELKQQ